MIVPTKSNYEVYIASSQNDAVTLVYVTEERRDIYSFQLSIPGDLQNLKFYQNQLIIVMNSGVYSIDISVIKQAEQKIQLQQLVEAKGAILLNKYI